MKFIEKALLINLILAIFSTLNANEFKDKTTQWDITDNGYIIYLDRHELDCDKGAISYFRMFREYKNGGGTDRVQYRYSCLNSSSIGKSSLANTPYNGYSGRHTINSLDEHDVRCPDGQVLQKFKLSRNPKGDKIRYDYKCAKADILCCKSFSSTPQELGDKSVFYLDRQEAGQLDSMYWSLAQFRLTAGSLGKHIHYSYKMCKLRDLEAVQELKDLTREQVALENNLKTAEDRHRVQKARCDLINKQIADLETHLTEIEIRMEQNKPVPGKRTRPNFERFRRDHLKNVIAEIKKGMRVEKIILNSLQLNKDSQTQNLKSVRVTIESFKVHPGLVC